MALVEIEGFDHQLAAADLITNIATTGDEWLWSTLTLSGTVLVPGQPTGNALALGSTGLFGGTLSTPFSGATVIIGCSIKIPIAGSALIGFWDSSSQSPPSTMQMSILLDAATGVISIYRGSPSGTLLHATASGQVPVGSWFYFEAKVTIASAAGAIAIQLRGRPYLTLAGLNTQAGAGAVVDSLFFGGGGSALVDHVYIEDTTVGPGSNPCNDFLGRRRVFTRFPDGVGASTQFTPLSGANYTQVREHAMDSDTSYNYDSGNPPGDKDLFPADSIPKAAPLACKITGSYREAGSAPIYAVVNKLLSGLTEVDGASVTIFPTYTYQSDIYPQDPDAGPGDWTEAAIDASQIGYQVVSASPPPPPPPPPLSIEPAVAVATYVTPTITTRTITYNTHHPDEVLVLYISMNSFSGPPAPVVVSVSSTSGLVWHQRAAASGQTTGFGSYYGDIEVWWAVAATPLVAETVTVVTTVANSAFLIMELFGAIGINTTAPWDTNVSLPAISTNLNGGAPSTTEVTGVSTSNANDLILFFYFDSFGAFSISATGPITLSEIIGDTEVNAFSGIGIDAYIFGSAVSATISGATLVGHRDSPAVDGPLDAWMLIADALRAV